MRYYYCLIILGVMGFGIFWDSFVDGFGGGIGNDSGDDIVF